MERTQKRSVYRDPVLKAVFDWYYLSMGTPLPLLRKFPGLKKGHGGYMREPLFHRILLTAPTILASVSDVMLAIVLRRNFH